MSSDRSFRYSVKQISPSLIEIEYAGAMSDDTAHLRETEAVIKAATRTVGMLYCVPEFSSFHPSQVKAHADLFTRMRAKVTGIAVLQPQSVVRFGAVTVGLISKTPLKAFDDRATALAWLDQLATPTTMPRRR